MENMTLTSLLKVSLVIPVLLFCSVIMVAYALERFWAFLKIGRLEGTIGERIKQFIRQGQVKEAIALCTRNPNFITHALEVALNAASFPREEMESIFALYRMKLQGLLTKHLAIFGTLSFIAPLLGLLGTVLGVIRAFRDLALSGSGGPTIVAAGIAEALIATAAGIAVAVTSAVLYNYFTTRVRTIVQQYDLLSQEVAILVYTGNEKHH
ncbi:MAG: MotA/TolQ/ExbB proton channel family protein [Elusimicrobiota bacterium]|jgi:biopolymer transport protein ExbB